MVKPLHCFVILLHILNIDVIPPCLKKNKQVFYASTQSFTFKNERIKYFLPPSDPLKPPPRVADNDKGLLGGGGIVRRNVLSEFPNLEISLAKYERAFVAKSGENLEKLVITDVNNSLKESQSSGRKSHWKIMVELFGYTFWTMF